jgi:hypothetical protein
MEIADAHDAAAHGLAREGDPPPLSAVADAEFLVEVEEMLLDRRFADREQRGDLTYRRRLDEQL